MSALSGTTLSVSGTSVLTGGANINGTTNTNNLNIINNSNFTQSGIGTFSTGTGAVLLNGATTTQSTLVVGTDLTVNSIINMNAPNGILKLPSGRQITNVNDVVDNTSNQSVAGVKTFTGQIVANAGINAGANSITCGSLTCSSETDSGVLTVTGQLNANGGIVTSNSNINAGTGSITCGSLTCSSETDSGSFTVGGTLYLGSGATNYLQLLQSSNAIYYDFLQSGGSHNFRYVYSGGSTSILSMSNTAVNMYQPLSTNNNNINAGTGTVSCGKVASTTDLFFTATNGENIMKLGGDNSSEILQLYKNSVGSISNQGNSYMSIRQDMGSDQGIIVGIDAASFSQFNSQAYIDTIRGGVSGNTPLNLKVIGTTVMQLATNGITAYQPISTNNNNINAGTGTITCGANFNIGAYGTSNMLQYSNGQLYFTNNASTAASSANANAGFNFRNLYFNGTGNSYQNFLLINDKTDGTNYYNNNLLPILASGGITSSGLITANANIKVTGSVNPRIDFYDTLSPTPNRYFFSAYQGGNSFDIGMDQGAGAGHTINIMPDGSAKLSVSATAITATPNITANGGITIPTGQVITLPTSYSSAPASTALGGNVGTTVISAVTFTSGTIANIGTGITVPAGVYMFSYYIPIVSTSTNSITYINYGFSSSSSSFATYTTSQSSSFATQNITTTPYQISGSTYVTYLSASSTIYFLINMTFSGAGTVKATNIQYQATRIG